MRDLGAVLVEGVRVPAARRADARNALSQRFQLEGELRCAQPVSPSEARAA